MQKDKSQILLNCPFESCPWALQDDSWGPLYLRPREWSEIGNCSLLLQQVSKEVVQATIFMIKGHSPLPKTETLMSAPMNLYWNAGEIYKRKYYTWEERRKLGAKLDSFEFTGKARMVCSPQWHHKWAPTGSFAIRKMPLSKFLVRLFHFEPLLT